MSSWNNYAVKVTDEKKADEIRSTLEQLGLNTWGTDTEISATDFGGGDVSSKEVKRALSQYAGGEVTALIHVSANDTSDTASGRAYSCDGGSFTKERSEMSGGESTRRNWYGINYNGISMGGGKF